MLNKDLFDNEKDAEIARLSMQIESYKRYDERRKAYYADKMHRLGELESLLSEVMDGEREDAAAEAVKLREEVRRLNAVIRVRRIEERRSPDELSRIEDLDGLLRENEVLRRQVQTLRSTVSDMVAIMNSKKSKEGHDEGKAPHGILPWWADIK